MALNPWSEHDLWIEKKWMKEGVFYINDDRWNSYVYGSKRNGKPWLINFGNTMFGAPDADSLFSSILQKSICIARHLGDVYNVGFGDYRAGEMILETYDFEWGQYAKMAPLQLVVKEGILYQLPQSNFPIIYYTEALKAIEKEAAYKAPVSAARDDLTIYWEYAKRDLGKKRWPSHFDIKVREYYNIEEEDGNTYFGRATLLDLFGSQNSDKTQGANFIYFVILPIVLFKLLILYLACRCACKLCCGQKRTTTSKVSTPSHPPRPSSREKREKVE